MGVDNCTGTTLTLLANASTASSGSGDALQFASNYVTMASGPQILLMPGDQLWTDGFYFGATVWAAFNYVSNAAASTSGPSTSVALSSPCPTGMVFSSANAPVIDVTSNTDLNYATACAGSTLTLHQAASVTSGDVLSLPVNSTSLPLATAAGNQTIEVVGVNNGLGTPPNGIQFTALVSHSAGSGYMWNVPTCIRRRVTSSAHQYKCQGWPIAEGISASSGNTPSGLATTTIDAEEQIIGNLVGRLTGGNNVAASTDGPALYGDNYLADIVDWETIGSEYNAVNPNSLENGTAPFGVMGNCGLNIPVFLGSYVYVTSSNRGIVPFCMTNNGRLDWSPAIPGTPGSGPLFINPLDRDSIRFQ